MSDIDILGTLAPNAGSTAPLSRAAYMQKGFAVVADSTERDTTISSGAKSGGFIVYRVDTLNFERWNGSSWVVISVSGGGLNSVTTVATANQATMTGLAQTINGVALNTDGMTVLLTAQSTASQNGPWIVHSGAWTRPTYFAAGNDAAGVLIIVQQGSALGDTAWLCTTNSGSAVIGTNNLTFIEVTEAGITVADETTLTKSGLTYSVKALGVGTAQLANLGVTTGKVANTAITGSKLAAGTAAGQELFWDGTQYLLLGRKTGTALTDANATLQYTTAPQWFWPLGVNTTAIRTLTLGTTGLSGLPLAGSGAIINLLFLRSLSHNVVINNGGPAGAGGFKGSYTVPAGYGIVAVAFYFDGTDWSHAGQEDYATVTVM